MGFAKKWRKRCGDDRESLEWEIFGQRTYIWLGFRRTELLT
jgi:hypothetical protein